MTDLAELLERVKSLPQAPGYGVEWGRCVDCGRVVALRKNGTPWGHGPHRFRCPGTGIEPEERQ